MRPTDRIVMNLTDDAGISGSKIYHMDGRSVGRGQDQYDLSIEYWNRSQEGYRIDLFLRQDGRDNRITWQDIQRLVYHRRD